MAKTKTVFTKEELLRNFFSCGVSFCGRTKRTAKGCYYYCENGMIYYTNPTLYKPTKVILKQILEKPIIVLYHTDDYAIQNIYQYDIRHYVNHSVKIIIIHNTFDDNLRNNNLESYFIKEYMYDLGFKKLTALNNLQRAINNKSYSNIKYLYDDFINANSNYIYHFNKLKYKYIHYIYSINGKQTNNIKDYYLENIKYNYFVPYYTSNSFNAKLCYKKYNDYSFKQVYYETLTISDISKLDYKLWYHKYIYLNNRYRPNFITSKHIKKAYENKADFEWLVMQYNHKGANIDINDSKWLF